MWDPRRCRPRHRSRRSSPPRRPRGCGRRRRSQARSACSGQTWSPGSRPPPACRFRRPMRSPPVGRRQLRRSQTATMDALCSYASPPPCVQLVSVPKRLESDRGSRDRTPLTFTEGAREVACELITTVERVAAPRASTTATLFGGAARNSSTAEADRVPGTELPSRKSIFVKAGTRRSTVRPSREVEAEPAAELVADDEYPLEREGVE